VSNSNNQSEHEPLFYCGDGVHDAKMQKVRATMDGREAAFLG
jgi:hypothetical protein